MRRLRVQKKKLYSARESGLVLFGDVVFSLWKTFKFVLAMATVELAMFKLDPQNKFDVSKPQEWPTWKQRFELLKCATTLTKEDEALQINAFI